MRRGPGREEGGVGEVYQRRYASENGIEVYSYN